MTNCFEDEIAIQVVQFNFLKALELAEEWYKSLPAVDVQTEEKKIENTSNLSSVTLAKEAYLLSKVFLNKQDRIRVAFPGKARAYIYLEILEYLRQIRIEYGYDVLQNTIIWKSFYHAIHSLIAKELISAFSGQEIYNLHTDEIIILSKSLIIIKDWQSVHEVLTFILKAKQRDPLVYLLLSYIFYQQKDLNQSYIFLRDALFFNPTVLDLNWSYFPFPDYETYWKEAQQLYSRTDAQYRHFALLLEIHSFYKSKKILRNEEFQEIEKAYIREYTIYSENKLQRQDLRPRVLHLLYRIIEYHIQKKNLSFIKELTDIINTIDSEVGSIISKNLAI